MDNSKHTAHHKLINTNHGVIRSLFALAPISIVVILIHLSIVLPLIIS